MPEKTFSSNIAEELGINSSDLKLIIAVKGDGTQEVFTPEGARVEEVPDSLAAGSNAFFAYTAADGARRYCYRNEKGRIVCV